MADGIYTAYLSGDAGQGLAMFVFREGVIAGADIAGLVFRGKYSSIGDRVVGEIEFTMPAQSISITGAPFEQASETIRVPIDLPKDISEQEIYRIETPIGPMNARFVKNVSF